MGTKKLLFSAGLMAAVALAAFAANGFGLGGGDSTQAVTATTVKTHRVAAPPAMAPAVGKRQASLFKITYRSTDPVLLGAGVHSVTIKKCPKGAGILNGWYTRTGGDPAFLLSLGGQPDGVRKWTLAVNNTSGGNVNAKYGIICIK